MHETMKVRLHSISQICDFISVKSEQVNELELAYGTA